ncbi:Lef-3 protein [Dolichomitus sp. PSUC_FEM 10030005]|nr:Lef-3 protein [Dolichomitus sp. PSUC_FEM 10030005]
MFNVFEFSTPSTRTLVAFQSMAQLNCRVMSQTYYPEFQAKLARLYIKAKSFIQLCNENTLGALVLSPIVPLYALDSYLERNRDQRYNVITNWEESNFAVILHDFATSIHDNSTIKRNIWNIRLFNCLFEDAEYSNLSHLMKYLLILVANLQEHCNFNMENFVGCINQIFGKTRAEQIGVDDISAEMLFSTVDRATTTENADSEVKTAQDFRDEDRGSQVSVENENHTHNVDNSNDEHTCESDNNANSSSNSAQINMDIASKNIMPRYTANAYVLEPGMNQVQTQYIRSMISFVQRKKARLRAQQNAILENVTVDAVVTRKSDNNNTVNHTTLDAMVRGLSGIPSNGYSLDDPPIQYDHRAESYTRKLPTRTSENDVSLGTVIVLSVLVKLESIPHTVFNEIDPSVQQSSTTLRFLFLLASWLIRIGPRHAYTRTHLFEWVNNNRQALYNELSKLIHKTTGALLRCYSFPQFSKLFKRYDEITRVNTDRVPESPNGALPRYLHRDVLGEVVNDNHYRHEDTHNFVNLSQREIDILVPSYLRDRVPSLIEAQSNNDKKMIETYYDNTIQAIAFQILYSEFSFGKFNDFLVFLLSLFQKGNKHRKFGLFYGVSKSFKTRVLEMIGNILRSTVVKNISSSAIATPHKNDFDPMAIPMAFNTIVNIDEVSRLSIQLIKTRVGNTPIPTRDMHGSSFLAFPTSATIAITTNVGFSLDFAGMSRVKLFRRNCPFCEVNDDNAQNRWLPKIKCGESAVSLVGGMILNKCIIECLNGGEEIGIYTVCRYLWPFFFDEYASPIPNYESETMIEDFQHYLQSNYHVANFFASFEVVSVPNGMSVNDLFRFTHEWWRQNAIKFSSQPENDHKNFYVEVSQKLAHLRHNQYYNFQLKPKSTIN